MAAVNRRHRDWQTGGTGGGAMGYGGMVEPSEENIASLMVR